MQQTKIFLGLAIACLALFSCEKKNVDDNVDDNNIDTCAKVWTVKKSVGASVSASISGGYLLLSSTNTAASSVPLTIYQNGISGDFEATFSYENFESGTGVGGYVQLAVTDTLGATGNRCTAGIGTLPVVGISAVVDSTGSDNSHIVLKSSTSTSGTFNMKRLGKLLTVTTISGTDTAKVSSSFSSNALQVGFQLGNNNATAISGITSIKITDFTIVNGGGVVKSDKFDCNSIK
ncbi:MAG: hypothetical protein NT150_04090 [Bacteroidetes bacterium]|nr:hypothetical protein [Bacteroidota bacterium]